MQVDSTSFSIMAALYQTSTASDRNENRLRSLAAPTLSHLKGMAGVAETMLRPAGVATIDGRRYEVLSEGDFIPPQTRILVDKVEGAKIFVKRA